MNHVWAFSHLIHRMRKNDDEMLVIVDICAITGKSQYCDFPWKNHSILDNHGKSYSYLFLEIHGKSKNIFDFLENPIYFGYTIHRKSRMLLGSPMGKQQHCSDIL